MAELGYYVVYRQDTRDLVGIYDTDPLINDSDLVTAWRRGPKPPLSRFVWDKDIAAFQPVEQIGITRLAFRNRFTADEKRAIYAAAEQSVDVRIWLDDLNAATVVYLNYPAMIAAVQSLEAAGLIGAGRAAEILEIPVADYELAE